MVDGEGDGLSPGKDKRMDETTADELEFQSIRPDHCRIAIFESTSRMSLARQMNDYLEREQEKGGYLVSSSVGLSSSCSWYGHIVIGIREGMK